MDEQEAALTDRILLLCHRLEFYAFTGKHFEKKTLDELSDLIKRRARLRAHRDGQ